MDKATVVTFRLPTAKKKALDSIAEGLDRDRSYVLNEAVDNFLEMHRWQIEQIKKGMAEAKAGKFAPEEEVAEAFARFRRVKTKRK